MQVWETGLSGELAATEEAVYLYAQDGLYHLDVNEKSWTRILELRDGNPNMGTIEPIADGGLILVHSDAYDRRLLRFDAQGKEVWERSLRQLPRGQWQLRSIGRMVYLLISHSSLSGTTADLYHVDPATASLTHILRSGSHHAYTRNTWMQPMNEGFLLINVGGGSLAGYDPLMALERLTSP
jgi:hypothetical protein